MRGYTADERWALGIMGGPCIWADALTPEGARLDGMMRVLIERGCVHWLSMVDDSGTSFCLTELGRVAAKITRYT